MDRARTLFEEGYRIRAEMGDLSRMALSLANTGWASFELGDMARAREDTSRALAFAREVGDRRHMYTAVDALGWIALAEVRIDAARDLFTEALALAQQIANPAATRVILYGLAAVAGASGDGRLAARLGAAAKPEITGGSHLVDPLMRAMIDRYRAAARADTDPAQWEEAWAAGAALTIEQAAAEVLGM
jgi:tetratricopeptide (TPR) repeat protein